MVRIAPGRGVARVLWTGLATVCLLLGSDCGSPQGARQADQADRPPHIVVYLADTLRADHLGLYGHSRPTSPRLDALGEEAVVFERAYAPSSWTKASTASLLTGLDPLAHGAVSRRHRVPSRTVLVAEALSERGYRTGAVVTNPHVVARFGFDQGFDAFRDLGKLGIRPRELRSDRVHRELVDLLPRRGGPPVFLYVHTIDPHAPNNPPAPYDRLFTDDPQP